MDKQESSDKRPESPEQELKNLFLQAPVGMVILIGPEFRFSFANPPYERFMGRKVIGKTVREVFTKEEATQFIPPLEKVYHTGQPHRETEMPFNILDENGTIQNLWLDFGYYPFRDEHGEIKGVLAVANDVTKQVRARHEISSVLDAIPVSVTRVDLEERFIFANKSHETYFGPIEKVLGKTFREYFGDYYDRFKDKVQTALTGKTVEFEWPSPPLEDGVVHYFIANYIPERSPDGKTQGFIASVFNIDELKKSQALLETERNSLREERENLKIEREMRERFVSTLSHDLRTPLTAAKMSAQLVGRRAENAAAVRKLAARIIDCIDRSDKMIQDLLDANKIKAGGKLSLEIKEFNLINLIEETLDELTTIHGDRFSLNAPVQPILGFWDYSGIQRILENLCNNGVKYGSPDHKITVEATESESKVFLSVHNWGSLISPEDQKALFEPYRRTASAQERHQKGWGLGLTLVKGLAEAHGGNVEVESLPDRGTTFRVKLPLDAREIKR